MRTLPTESEMKQREMQLGRKLPRVDRSGVAFACRVAGGFEIRRSYETAHALSSTKYDSDQPSNRRGYITTYRERTSATYKADLLNAEVVERNGPDAHYVHQDDVDQVLANVEPSSGFFTAVRSNPHGSYVVVNNLKTGETVERIASDFLREHHLVRRPK